MKSARLYGAGGHSQVIREILEGEGFQISQTYDDRPEGRHYASRNVNQGARKNMSTFEKSDIPLVIAVGNNVHRKEIACLVKASFLKVIHPTAIISKSVLIGEGTVVFAGTVIQPNTIIGKHAIINTSASIDHDCVIGDYVHISPKSALCGHVEVGEGSHVGVGAVVIPKIKIGKWCTIGAGAVVIRDVPDYAVIVGNPARLIKYNEKQELNNSDSGDFDIVFIGSGISTSFTLSKICERLFANPESRPLRVLVLERYSEFNTGIPYGKRSGDSVLLINSLQEFLPLAERSKFIDWMKNNLDWLLYRLREVGGQLTKNWINENEPLMREDKWQELFLPRSFFGFYIDEQVKQKVKIAESRGLLQVVFRNENVIDVERIDEKFKLSCSSEHSFISKKIVLAVGSLPSKTRLSCDIRKMEYVGLLEEPYTPSLNEGCKIVQDCIDRLNGQLINLLIIGANASALEVLYRLVDSGISMDRIGKVIFLSSLGIMPDSKSEEFCQTTFVPANLLRLEEVSELTANQIFTAAFKDIETARLKGFGAASTVDTLAKVYCSLFGKLSDGELRKFATRYGNEIGRRQRCAGRQYLSVVNLFHNSGRFEHLKGRFERVVRSTEKTSSYLFEYREHGAESVSVYPEPVHVVVNCAGCCTLDDAEVPPLVRRLMERGYAEPNDSRIGFQVNENLETINNLHVVGPLVAGNLIEGKPVWHVEHCGRIIWLSDLLSKVLAHSFAVS